MAPRGHNSREPRGACGSHFSTGSRKLVDQRCLRVHGEKLGAQRPPRLPRHRHRLIDKCLFEFLQRAPPCRAVGIHETVQIALRASFWRSASQSSDMGSRGEERGAPPLCQRCSTLCCSARAVPRRPRHARSVQRSNRFGSVLKLARLQPGVARRPSRHSQRGARCAWLQLGLSMLTQLDARASFPVANGVLALWGCYCGHCGRMVRRSRALPRASSSRSFAISSSVLWHSPGRVGRPRFVRLLPHGAGVEHGREGDCSRCVHAGRTRLSVISNLFQWRDEGLPNGAPVHSVQQPRDARAKRYSRTVPAGAKQRVQGQPARVQIPKLSRPDKDLQPALPYPQELSARFFAVDVCRALRGCVRARGPRSAP